MVYFLEFAFAECFCENDAVFFNQYKRKDLYFSFLRDSLLALAQNIASKTLKKAAYQITLNQGIESSNKKRKH